MPKVCSFQVPFHISENILKDNFKTSTDIPIARNNPYLKKKKKQKKKKEKEKKTTLITRI